jgi:hypothetical protein
MHNELAWRVLGVDPATQKDIEHSAAQDGVSLGRFLEMTMAALRNAAAQNSAVEQAIRKQDERLRDLMADMAESLMAASDTLRNGRPRAEKAVEPQVKPTERNEVREAEPSRSKNDDPLPNIEQLQSWRRALDEKPSPAEQKKPSRFSVLRRSA